MKKRLLSAVLAFAMVLVLLPGTALADKDANDVAYPVTGGNIYFDKASGMITGHDASVIAVNIPNEIDGVIVTSIGDSAFAFCSSLVNVTIPSSVTSIGHDAFSHCSSLTNVIKLPSPTPPHANLINAPNAPAP